MKKIRHYYLIRVQYLGFRFSGWQKQPKQKTVEEMIVKTLRFILPGRKFKILGAGRTDAKVSALDSAFELFLEDTAIDNCKEFMYLFNKNLPPDIRVMDIKSVDSSFNIIKHAKVKEYMYLFSFGSKNHPFCAPFMANFHEELHIDDMKTGAKLFEGTHDFRRYTSRPKEDTKTLRTINRCEITDNTVLTGDFFPERSYVLYIEGKGFLRYQVRMIMGALVQLGRKELSLSDIKLSLNKNSTVQLTFVAPGSGLLLNRLTFE